MIRVMCYIKALLKRHWVSFIFASVIPAIVGLFAVAAITVVEYIHSYDYLYDKYYEDVICIAPDLWNSQREGIHIGGYGYQYSEGTQAAEYLNSLPEVGKFGSVEIAMTDRFDAQVTVVDYTYWQTFPRKLYNGNGFTGTRNEILLDIRYVEDYKINKEYEFSVNVYQRDEILPVKAVVVGFTRLVDYADFNSNTGLMCLPNDAEAQKLNAYYANRRYVKIPKDNLIYWCYGKYNEDFIFDEPEAVFTIGLNKQNSTMEEDDINKFALAVFVAIALSMLAVISDLCLNGSMLKRTERIAVRSGLRNRDVTVAYIVKALLQLALSTGIMLGVVLYFNHKTGALLILESLWGGVIAVLFLGLVSWTIDNIRLYRSWKIKC